MRVVDTFLFAEAYEAELLLAKLHCESPVVDEFVLVESTHTFRGEEKGLQARALVGGDDRFAPFRDRLTVIEHAGRLFEGPPCYETYYENEERSRASVWPHVAARFSPRDWVLVSDVDEMVDGTDPARAAAFRGHLAAHAGWGRALRFGHYRYWYDWDNRCYWAGVVTPAAQVGAIRRGASTLRCRSRPPAGSWDVPAGDRPLFFEYTFCFPREAMWRKLNSFIHDGYAPRDLEVALLTNHWVKAPSRGERPGQQSVDWLETVVLDEANSPKYVRDNLARLKTHAVPQDYREHRRRLYGR
jgi:hypothetical protein